MHMKSSSARRLLCTSAFATIGLVMCGGAHAQTSAPITTTTTGLKSSAETDATPSDQPAGLQEITVTAQRRNESGQKVPIAIQAISDTQLKQMGVANTNDLPLAVPGFQISSSAVNQLYYLRGVGSQQVGVGTSAAVATFVDGVYMPFTASALQGFSNITSVEVDKGPQGTLFGRNATGGVIQINTKDPKSDFGLEASAGYGNYNHTTGSLYITGGVSDNIAVDLSLLADRQADGYGRNLTTGGDVYKRSIYGARSKVLITLSDKTELRLAADVSRVEGDQGSAIKPAKGVTIFDLATNAPQVIAGFYDVTVNTPADHKTTDWGVSAKINSDLGWANFQSISAYRAYDTKLNVDFDGGPSTVIPIFNHQYENSFTQELQLSSSDNQNFKWTVGAFYLRQNGYISPFEFGAPFPSISPGFAPFGIPLGDRYELTAKSRTASYAAYGQVTIAFASDTHLTLGGRYTYEIRKIEGSGAAAGPVAPAPFVIPFTVGKQRATFNKPTFRVVLDHDFSPSAKVYASFNRGFQSGTFNANNAPGYSAAFNPVLQPENIDAYEVGFKSELFGRTLRLNSSAFYYNYTNLQQQTYVGGALQTLNAGGAHIKGVDLEIRYQPNSNFTIGIVGEYLDAKFTDFLNAPGYTYVSGVFGVGPLVPTPIPNAKGNRLGFAPALTGTIFTNYSLETSVGKFNTSGTLAYNDGYYVDPGNLYKEPSFLTANLSEEWVANDNVSMTFFVKNLFDKKYDQAVAAVGIVGFVGNTPGAPREYGVTARYRL
jgi:iron complex outermembrane receptor protein